MDEGTGGRQARWQELTKRECFDLLTQEHLGRIALVNRWGPVVLPVNYVLDRHTVVFRTGEGTKLDAASRGPRVAFEVDGTDALTRTGWSVAVRGRPSRSPTRPSWPACASCRCTRGHPAPSTGTSELHGQLEPERGHRVIRAEVILGQLVIPGHVQRAGHVGVPSAGATDFFRAVGDAGQSNRVAEGWPRASRPRCSRTLVTGRLPGPAKGRRSRASGSLCS